MMALSAILVALIVYDVRSCLLLRSGIQSVLVRSDLLAKRQTPWQRIGLVTVRVLYCTRRDGRTDV